MPTVLRSGPYRFFFFSNESREPPHVHVETGSGYSKFRLRPPVLAFSVGLSARQLRVIRGLIAWHEKQFLEAWDEHFGH